MIERARDMWPRGEPMTDYLSREDDFGMLSISDLLKARDEFHLHLVHKANVVGTAIGRYRIRKSEPWPGKGGEKGSSTREPLLIPPGTRQREGRRAHIGRARAVWHGFRNRGESH
jgi:hypothetical protein